MSNEFSSKSMYSKLEIELQNLNKFIRSVLLHNYGTGTKSIQIRIEDVLTQAIGLQDLIVEIHDQMQEMQNKFAQAMTNQNNQASSGSSNQYSTLLGQSSSQQQYARQHLLAIFQEQSNLCQCLVAVNWAIIKTCHNPSPTDHKNSTTQKDFTDSDHIFNTANYICQENEEDNQIFKDKGGQSLLIDFRFVETFLRIIKDRLQYCYNTLINLAQSLNLFQQLILQGFGNKDLSEGNKGINSKYSHATQKQEKKLNSKDQDSRCAEELLDLLEIHSIRKNIQKAQTLIQAQMRPVVVDLQNRAQLALPLLSFLTSAISSYCEPVDALLLEIRQHHKRFQFLKPRLNKSIETKFTKDKSSATNSLRKNLFDEIHQLITFGKRLEFQIRSHIQQAIQLFAILNQSGKKNYKSLLLLTNNQYGNFNQATHSQGFQPHMAESPFTPSTEQSQTQKLAEDSIHPGQLLLKPEDFKKIEKMMILFDLMSQWLNRNPYSDQQAQNQCSSQPHAQHQKEHDENASENNNQTNQLWTLQFEVEIFVMQVNLPEFLNVFQLLLDQPRSSGLWQTYLHNYPLVREGIDTNLQGAINEKELKELCERCKKIHQKLNQIQEYEPPKEIITSLNEADAGQVSIAEKDVPIVERQDFVELILWLKTQHEFIWERDQLKTKFVTLASKCENFLNLSPSQQKEAEDNKKDDEQHYQTN